METLAALSAACREELAASEEYAGAVRSVAQLLGEPPEEAARISDAQIFSEEIQAGLKEQARLFERLSKAHALREKRIGELAGALGRAERDLFGLLAALEEAAEVDEKGLALRDKLADLRSLGERLRRSLEETQSEQQRLIDRLRSHTEALGRQIGHVRQGVEASRGYAGMGRQLRNDQGIVNQRF